MRLVGENQVNKLQEKATQNKACALIAPHLSLQTQQNFGRKQATT